jgi:hypothetical protein
MKIMVRHWPTTPKFEGYEFPSTGAFYHGDCDKRRAEIFGAITSSNDT